MKKAIGLLAIGLVSMAFVIKSSPNQPQESEGIKFEHMTLAEAKLLAEENDQLIFIDAHTSWCGPCKKMAATSFKDQAVGDAFNEQFINLKIDCEKDVDGIEISKLYKIKAYPTLLIIDSKGKLIKEVIGFQTVDRLLDLAKSVE